METKKLGMILSYDEIINKTSGKYDHAMNNEHLLVFKFRQLLKKTIESVSAKK